MWPPQDFSLKPLVPELNIVSGITDDVSTYKGQLNGGFIGKSLTGICLRKTGASLDG